MISIIIPIYNAEQYLQECILSVINQTNTDWELLLIDDSSEDESIKICKCYAAQDIRIKYYLCPHKGVSCARNMGIDQAKGEYVFFMDADDYLRHDALSLLINKMQKSGADIVCAECQPVMHNGAIYPHTRPTFEDELIDNYKFLCDVLTYNTLCSVWAKLYKRSLIADYRFVIGLFRAQDIMFHTTVFSQSQCKVLRCSDRIYYYRILQNSISHVRNPHKQIERVRGFINAMLDFKYNHIVIEKQWYKEFSYNILRNVLDCIEHQGVRKQIEDWHITTIKSYLPKCSSINDNYTSLATNICRTPVHFRNVYLTIHYLPKNVKNHLRKFRNNLLILFLHSQ